MQFDPYIWLLVFVRVGAFMSVLPFFSTTNFPIQMRVAIAAFTAVLVAPVLPPLVIGHMDIITLLGLMIIEAAIGTLLGFVARMAFYAADMAGIMVSMEMGLNLSPVYNPMTRSQTQAPGNVLFMLAAMVMLTLDLHHWMLIGFQKTYSLVPMGFARLSTFLFETVVAHTSQLFWIALQIAAPMIAVSFTVTLVFAILSRSVPQMNVFSESYAFKICAGFIVFGLTLHLMAQHIANHLRKLPDDLGILARILSGQ